jgi:hypothetical protein
MNIARAVSLKGDSFFCCFRRLFNIFFENRLTMLSQAKEKKYLCTS